MSIDTVETAFPVEPFPHGGAPSDAPRAHAGEVELVIGEIVGDTSSPSEKAPAQKAPAQETPSQKAPSQKAPVRAGRLSEPSFRARVLTPILFIAMILVPASVLVAVALTGSDTPAGVPDSSGQANTAAVVGG
jgi:hypothetical protein